MAALYGLQAIVCIIVLTRLRRKQEQMRIRKAFFVLCLFACLIRSVWFGVPDSLFSQSYLPQNHSPDIRSPAFLLNAAQFTLYSLPNIIFFEMYCLLITYWIAVIHIMFVAVQGEGGGRSPTKQRRIMENHDIYSTWPSNTDAQNATRRLLVAPSVEGQSLSGSAPVDPHSHLIPYPPAHRFFMWSSGLAILLQITLLTLLFFFKFFWIVLSNCIFVTLLALGSAIGYVAYAIMTVRKLRPLYARKEHPTTTTEEVLGQSIVGGQWNGWNGGHPSTMDGAYEPTPRLTGPVHPSPSPRASRPGRRSISPPLHAIGALSRSAVRSSALDIEEDERADLSIDRGVRGRSARRNPSIIQERGLSESPSMCASPSHSASGSSGMGTVAGSMAGYIPPPIPGQTTAASTAAAMMAAQLRLHARSHSPYNTLSNSRSPPQHELSVSASASASRSGSGSGSRSPPRHPSVSTSHSQPSRQSPYFPHHRQQHSTLEATVSSSDGLAYEPQSDDENDEEEGTPEEGYMSRDEEEEAVEDADAEPDLSSATDHQHAHVAANASAGSDVAAAVVHSVNTSRQGSDGIIHSPMRSPARSISGTGPSAPPPSMFPVSTVSPVQRAIREDDFFVCTPSPSTAAGDASHLTNGWKQQEMHANGNAPSASGKRPSLMTSSTSPPTAGAVAPLLVPRTAASPQSASTVDPSTSPLASFAYSQSRKIIYLSICVVLFSAARIASSMIELHYTLIEVQREEDDDDGSRDGGNGESGGDPSAFPSYWWVIIDAYYLCFELLCSAIASWLLTKSFESGKTNATDRSTINNEASSVSMPPTTQPDSMSSAASMATAGTLLPSPRHSRMPPPHYNQQQPYARSVGPTSSSMLGGHSLERQRDALHAHLLAHSFDEQPHGSFLAAASVP